MKKVDGGKIRVLKKSITLANTIGDCIETREEYEPNWC
jgi:hypothetical protein